MRNSNPPTIKKGMRLLFLAIPFLFISPIILNGGFKIQEKSGNIVAIIIGAILMALAIVFLFLGIRTVLKALFNN